MIVYLFYNTFYSLSVNLTIFDKTKFKASLTIIVYYTHTYSVPQLSPGQAGQRSVKRPK